MLAVTHLVLNCKTIMMNVYFDRAMCMLTLHAVITALQFMMLGTSDEATCTGIGGTLGAAVVVSIHRPFIGYADHHQMSDSRTYWTRNVSTKHEV